WILMLDPDERVPEHLAHELRRIAGDAAVDVVLIPRQVVMFGRAVRSPGVSDTTQTRFFRGGVILWPPEVHGRPDLTGLRCCDLSPHASKLSIRHDSWRSVAGVLDK